jgi:hypothetical protein
MLRLLPLVAVAVIAFGCGSEDDDKEKGSAPKGGPAAISNQAKLGTDGNAIANRAKEFLSATDASEVCFAMVAGDYLKSIGGASGCEKKLQPILRGNLSVVTAARSGGRNQYGNKTGIAQVESADGSEKRTILFAHSVSGNWNVDGFQPPVR